MSSLRFASVSKAFGSLRAVDDVTLEIHQGEIFSLLGPSGCGKTTLLRMAAGFEQPDAGTIWIGEADVTATPPERRPINTVFQNYALFPHLSARDNIAFGPRMAGLGGAALRTQVDEMLDLTRLQDHAHKKPAQLSGGQRQRVAIARALINKPKVLLLDEPLAALDLKLRQHMLAELRALHQKISCTFVFVTHDQTEAIAVSDRMAVLNEGHIEQVGTPEEIYHSPSTSFVASFIGSTNFLQGTVVWCQGLDGRASADDDLICRLTVASLGEVTARTLEPLNEGTPVQVSIRPEDWWLSITSPERTPGMNAVRGRLENIVYLGASSQFTVSVHGERLSIARPNRHLGNDGALQRGTEVWAGFHHQDALATPV